MASLLPSSISFVLFTIAWPSPAHALWVQGWKRRTVVSTALLLPAPALAQQRQPSPAPRQQRQPSPAQVPQPSVISTNKKRSVCRIELPNGAWYDASGDPLLQSAGCAHVGMAHGRGSLQIYASDAHVHASAPLSSFTADFVAPLLPSERPDSSQAVLLWPGLKAGQPELGYPVLQPVLAYARDRSTWTLQSWFVDGSDPNFPVVTAPAVNVEAGRMRHDSNLHALLPRPLIMASRPALWQTA